jgi:hypothetical protein
MTHSRRLFLQRGVTIILCVVFCCTARPALAQSHQTFTLNGLSADVISPAGPVRLGDPFYMSVEVIPHAGASLREFHVLLDGRPIGRRDGIELPDGIADGIPNNREWLEPSSLYATPGDVMLRITVTEATGRGGVFELPLRLLPATDADADTLPDLWELRQGLSAASAAGDDGPDGDPDADGSRNRDEFLRNTHPRGFYARYFAEGVADDFFDTSTQPAFLSGGSTARMHTRTVDADGWATSTSSGYQDVGQSLYVTPGYESRRRIASSFATIIESDAPFVAERTTKWPTFRSGSSYGYGSHSSEGTASLSTRWFFAEGVTGTTFHTYVALLNPSTRTATLSVVYLGGEGVTQIVREHTIAPDSRATIDVNADAAGLATTDLAIVIDSSEPIAAERSVYRDVGNTFWGAGTSTTGAPAAAAEWFFAEGVTNPAFDTYLVLLNPGATTADVSIEVLRADGAPITLTRTLTPRSRATVYMNSASPDLVSTGASFGLAVRSTNGTPIVAERSVWWNDPMRGTRWVEGHTAMGATAPATRWFAPGNSLTGAGGNASVYLLLANPGATPATVRVSASAAFPSAPTDQTTMTVPAFGRATLDVTATFAGVGRPDGRFAALLVESIGDTPAPIVAERSAYANTLDAVWELGSNTLLTPLLTPLPPLPVSPSAMP